MTRHDRIAVVLFDLWPPGFIDADVRRCADAIEAALGPDDRDEAVALLIRCGVVLAEREPHTSTDPDLIIDVARFVSHHRSRR